jgi:hypothetical protein
LVRLIRRSTCASSVRPWPTYASPALQKFRIKSRWYKLQPAVPPVALPRWKRARLVALAGPVKNMIARGTRVCTGPGPQPHGTKRTERVLTELHASSKIEPRNDRLLAHKFHPNLSIIPLPSVIPTENTGNGGPRSKDQAIEPIATRVAARRSGCVPNSPSRPSQRFYISNNKGSGRGHQNPVGGP